MIIKRTISMMVATFTTFSLVGTAFASGLWQTYGGDQKRQRVLEDGKTNIPVMKKWKLEPGCRNHIDPVCPINKKI